MSLTYHIKVAGKRQQLLKMLDAAANELHIGVGEAWIAVEGDDESPNLLLELVDDFDSEYDPEGKPCVINAERKQEA